MDWNEETKALDRIPIFGNFWKKLSRRPDSEHEQALIRVVLTGIVTIYLYCYWRISNHGPITPEEQRLLWTSAIYHMVSIIIFVLAARDPGSSPVRRWVEMLGDLPLAAYGISVTEEGCAPLYVIMLWVIFGNGFRYGNRYLFAASAIGTISFGIAISTSPFWQEKIFMGFGFGMGLALLPLYISSLLRKLTAAGERAKEASNAKSQFMANMSHELRTPLNGIMGMAELLSNTPLTPQQADFTQTIQASSATMLDLVNNVLDFSKLEAGKMEIKSIPFDLHSLAKNTVSMMRYQADEKNIALNLSVSPHSPYLLVGDPMMLRQIFLNLISNAIKFTSEGHVSFLVSSPCESEDQVSLEFTVTDTGIGMSADQCARIFDRFVQADDSTTRKYGGTGLGTSIAKQLTELMGGSIKVESEVGKGSTFSVNLTLNKQVSLSGGNWVQECLCEKKILVVATAPEQFDKIQSIFKRLNVDAEHVQKRNEALVKLATMANNPYDVLILVEPESPEIAVDFISSIKELGDKTKTKVILIKGENDTTPYSKFVSLGYDAILYYDYSKEYFLNALHFTVGNCQPPERKNGVFANIVPIIGAKAKYTAPNRYNVLLAEDNLINQKVILLFLEKMGHTVTLVGDGEKALDALEEKVFDVAIFDLNMPIMGGIEAAKIFRFANRGPYVPIIALTADITEQTRRECENARIDGYISKPVNSLDLQETMEAVVIKTKKDGRPSSLPGELIPFQADRREPRKPIDVQELEKMIGMGYKHEIVQNLLHLFMEDAKTKIEILCDAVKNIDRKAFMDITHELAGGAVQVKAMKFAMLCRNGMNIPEESFKTESVRFLEQITSEYKNLLEFVGEIA